MPFLTDIDSRAAIKGSRDPLGAQLVWTRSGRRVVGNLTTVTTSVIDFATLVLGYYFVERVAERDGPGQELATFLRWEQLAAYCRTEADPEVQLRGIERVRKALSEDEGKVTVSAAPSHLILSNQKTYGLWGLYTVAARASGLVMPDAPRLTPVALDLVERAYLPRLADGGGKDARAILEIVAAERTQLALRGRDRRIAEAVARALRRTIGPLERETFARHLRDGGAGDEDRTHGDQRRLADLLRGTLDDTDFTWSPSAVAGLAKAATARGSDWRSLAETLERIWVCESLLAPATSLFGYLQALDTRSLDQVTTALRENWGARLRTIDVDAVSALRLDLGGGDSAAADRWIAMAEAFARGAWGDAVSRVLEQNAAVMRARGGAAWIELREGSLEVRFTDEEGDLPDGDEVGRLWRHSYFVDSLRTVTKFLEEA